MLANASLENGRKTATAVSLDDLIPEDHVIRQIDDAIRWEERCAPLRACYNAQRGRPAFEPEVLLAIAVLRHVYKIDSLRSVSAEIQTNLIFRWFVGCPLGEAVPHFSTISANMLHRIPKKEFEAALCGALCDIIDAGVLSPDEIVRESSVLLPGGGLEEMTAAYFAVADQLAIALPADDPLLAEGDPVSANAKDRTEQLQISF